MTLPLLLWDAPGPYEVAFSTRVGGVSGGAFASLNLGRLTADEPTHVDENRRRLATAVDLEPERIALNRQVHTAVVRRAGSTGRVEPGDGLWSEEPGQALLALAADCLPIAVVRLPRARTRPALAVLHAGRRGLLAGIVGAGIEALDGPTAAVLGPAIGPCCYEVGPEVGEPFVAAFGPDVLRGTRLDLWLSAERALAAAGCSRVERVDLCTACHPELFFSHRRDAGVTGRQGVIGAVA